MFKPLSKQIKTAEILFTEKEPFTAESTENTENNKSGFTESRREDSESHRDFFTLNHRGEAEKHRVQWKFLTKIFAETRIIFAQQSGCFFVNKKGL